MMSDKIVISWDELKTRQVEQRVSAQKAMDRNRAYAQLTDAPEAAASNTRPSIWYNTIFYMAVFGLLGGMLAWGFGELLHFRPSARLESAELMAGVKEIQRAEMATRLSSEEAKAAIEELRRSGAHNPYFSVYSDPSLTEAQKTTRIRVVETRDAWKEFISNVLAYGVSGLLIAMCLAAAEPIVSRNIPSAIINGSVGATLGLIGGIAVALFVEKMYRALGGTDGMITSTKQILARTVTWSVVGITLSLAPGIVMGSWKKLLIGVAGGLIGGAVGGAMFDMVAKNMESASVSRLIGMIAIGVVAGVGSGLIENAAKNGWVRVVAGLIAGKQFVLYRNPTFIGSSPDNQIYLFKDEKVGRRHAAIHIVQGGFEIEDLPLGEPTTINGKAVTRQRLRHGDQIQVGATRFLFQEKQPAA